MSRKIEVVERTKQAHLRVIKDPRCECSTRSYGSYPFQESNNQCSRLAVFKIDGVNLCRLHSGDKLLTDELKRIGIL